MFNIWTLPRMYHAFVWLVLICSLIEPLTGRPHKHRLKNTKIRRNKHEKAKYRDFVTQRRDDVDIFQDFSYSHPILWSDTEKAKLENVKTSHPVNRQKIRHGVITSRPSKKDGAAPQSEDDMPNTVGPNPNIYGGFPENDIWGNFELPSAETIDHLKLSLKMNHHRPNYAGDQASDSIDQQYSYEHHALPEYDILETPQFHETPQGQKVLSDMASAGEGGCPGLGSCPPLNGKIACQSIQNSCSAKEQDSLPAVDYEAPCAAKILELFGCTKPESPATPPEEAKQESPANAQLKPIKLKAPKPGSAKIEAKEDKKFAKSPDENDFPEHKIKEHKLHHLAKENHGEEVSLPSENSLANEPAGDLMLEKEESNFKSNPLTDKFEMFEKMSAKHFHGNAKKKHSQETESISHGLSNDDDSLSLMQVVSSDLQKTLAEKFDSEDENANEKPDIIDNFMKVHNNSSQSSKPEHHEQNNTEKEVQEKQLTKPTTANDSATDTKELTSYFNSVRNDNHPPTNTITSTEGDYSQFSEWSNWSPCGNCDKGTRTRRRVCLRDQCSGSTEETAPCITTCKEEQKPSSLVPGMSLPDKKLLESIDPLNTKQTNPQEATPAKQTPPLLPVQNTPQSQILPPNLALFSQGLLPQIQSMITQQKQLPTPDISPQNQMQGFTKNVNANEKLPFDSQNEKSNEQSISKSDTDSDKAKEFEQMILNKTFESVVSSFTQQLNESLKQQPSDAQLQPPLNQQQQPPLNQLTAPLISADKIESANKEPQLFEILNNRLSPGATLSSGLPDSKPPHLVEQHIDSTQTILLNQGQDKNKINEYKPNNVAWSEWSECSTSCGIGSVTRTLKSDKEGSVKDTEMKYCHIKTCDDPQLEDSLKDGCLKLHNELRNRHDAGSLDWSNSLYKKAHEITERISMNEIPQQNLSQYERPGLNLNFVSLNPSNNDSLASPCKKAISEWYGEKLNYNYDTPKLTVEDRDFTQLVWKSTKKVGLASSFSPDGKSAYIAAVYEPVGNVDSLYDVKKHVMYQPKKIISEEQTAKVLSSLMNSKHKKSSIHKTYG